MRCSYDVCRDATSLRIVSGAEIKPPQDSLAKRDSLRCQHDASLAQHKVFQFPLARRLPPFLFVHLPLYYKQLGRKDRVIAIVGLRRK